MYIHHHVKYPVILSDFNEARFFFNTFSKNKQIPNFVKLRLVGAELFHEGWRTDGQADFTRLIIAFRNFLDPPKYNRT